MAVREQAPVIHVTIDRLDVRAPARRRSPRGSGRGRSLRSRCRTICAMAPGRAAMSSPLAIGAVSAVLRNLLDNGLVEAGAAHGHHGRR